MRIFIGDSANYVVIHFEDKVVKFWNPSNLQEVPIGVNVTITYDNWGRIESIEKESVKL